MFSPCQGGVANFKKSPIFTLKLHDLAISEKKKIGRRKPAKIFLGGQIFKKNLKQIRRQSKSRKSGEGVKKPFSRGWGRFEL